MKSIKSRRNQHYHSQRSVRSNVDNGIYHHYNGGSPMMANGHHQYSPSQFQAMPPTTNHSKQVRPASSFYEYETINPNGFYRKIEEQYNQIHINNKIINGSSSVRIGQGSSRAPIPDMSGKQTQGRPSGPPFITQVRTFLINNISVKLNLNF